MYNVFYRNDSIDGVRVRRFRVYKADNRNTMRRLHGEGWSKLFDQPTSDRSIAVAMKRKMANNYTAAVRRTISSLQELLDDYQRE